MRAFLAFASAAALAAVGCGVPPRRLGHATCHSLSAYSFPSYHPDGQAILFVGGTTEYGVDNPANLFEMRPDGTGLRQLTRFEYHTVRWPCYSPDGSLVAFNVIPNVGKIEPGIAVMKRDGSGFRLLPGGDGNPEICFGFMPDGKELLVMGLTMGRAYRYLSVPWDLFAIDLGSGKRRRITDAQFVEAGAPGGVSPEGRRAVLIATWYFLEGYTPKAGNGLYIVDLDSGRMVMKLSQSKHHYSSVAFSSDGKEVLTVASWDDARHSALLSINPASAAAAVLYDASCAEDYWRGANSSHPSADGRHAILLTGEVRGPEGHKTVENHLTIVDLSTRKGMRVTPEWSSVSVLPDAPSDRRVGRRVVVETE